MLNSGSVRTQLKQVEHDNNRLGVTNEELV